MITFIWLGPCKFFIWFCCKQDEICKSIAETGGIDTLLQCIDDSGEQGNKTAAKTCCSLLSKVSSF